MAGELQLGGTTLATHTGSGASAKITLDSGLVFPAGHVLQVVQSVQSTEVSTTSGTYVSANLTATITPISTSSKVLILVSYTGRLDTGASGLGVFAIFRGTVSGTLLVNRPIFSPYELKTGGSAINYLDSPSTTSAQTYTVGLATNPGTTVRINADGTTSTIILMEIAG